MNYVRRIDRGGDEPRPTGGYINFLGHLDMDPFAALDELGQHPLRWVESPNDVDGYWLATRFEDVRDILQDADNFSSTDSNIPFLQMAEPLLPTETDPPYTQKLRAVIMPHLTVKKVMAHDARMREVCASIIESFRADGKCDAVEQFSRVYPITIFIDFFGLAQERREEFRQQANVFLHDVEKRADAWARIRAIVEEALLQKRQTPADDLLSAIANGRIDGEEIPTGVAVSIASTVFLGGLDTLPSNIAWSLRFLATHPEYRQQLVDQPDLVPGAVEEFLRLYSVANPVRRATHDLDFRGANIVAGDRVMCSIAAADRDVATFGEKADFGRKVNPHLAFATGPHRCLGSHLARHELGIALSTWHRLIPDYRLAQQPAVTYSGPIFAIENLPLEWDV